MRAGEVDEGREYKGGQGWQGSYRAGSTGEVDENREYKGGKRGQGR